MAGSTINCSGDRALASASTSCQQMLEASTPSSYRTTTPHSTRPITSLEGSQQSISHYLGLSEEQRGTVLYLAYGSNLSNEKFKGDRGVEPLSQVNVQVPSLRLTFDLSGIPYAEPCFANTGLRDPDKDVPDQDLSNNHNEKSPLLGRRVGPRDYCKTKWHKGLVGVVYEVTPKDYAHIIATEGGGAGYHDILVDCHPFASSDPDIPVPQTPILPAFKAHTLYAPPAPSDGEPPEGGGRLGRPDPNYAQPSARYLKLLTDGADELRLPYEYQDYLQSIRTYTITTGKQRVGQFVFLGVWMPFIALLFAMGSMFADKDGRLPMWMRALSGAIFQAVWASYDAFFKPMFGDGERSIPDGGDEMTDADDDMRTSISRGRQSRRGVDIEKAAAAS